MHPAQPNSQSIYEQALSPSLATYWRSTIALTGVFIVSLLIWPPMLGGVPANPHPPAALLFFGRFHPLIVHLPIGVLIFSLLAKCNKCHNEAKSKGDLRMDTYDLAVKGGESGHNIEPGKPEDSLSVQRMNLAEDEDDHMPPKGKDQPTKPEIALIAWWIKVGASEQMKLSDAALPAELQATAEALRKR